MTARDDELREMAAAWALGSLSPEEAREFEALMARSPEVRSEAESYREVTAMLPLGAAVLAPDPGLKARVLARATGRAKRVPQLGRRMGDRYLRLALAASLLLGLAMLAQAVRVERERARLAREIVAVQRELEGRDSLLAAVFAPGVELHRLTTTREDAPEVQLFWNRRNQVALLHARRLPALGPDRAYQLWLIPEGGSPIPSSVFSPGADGDVLVRDVRLPLPTQGRYAAFAVTEEPAGGSRAPTTTPLFVAALPS
jgi:anti-sigma-K factor RskA